MAFSFVLSIIAFIIGVSAKKTKLTDDRKEKDTDKNERKDEEKPKFPEKNPIIVDAEIVEEKSEKKG
jgi:hypothetical protein